MASASREHALDSLLAPDGLYFSSPSGQPGANDHTVWQRQPNGTFICQVCRDARAHTKSKALRHAESTNHKNAIAYMAQKVQIAIVNEPSEFHASSSGHDAVPQAESQYSDSNLGYLPYLGNNSSDEINSLDSDLPTAQSEYKQIMCTLQDFFPNDDLSDEELVEQSALEHEDGTIHTISCHAVLVLKCQIAQNIRTKKRSRHKVRLKNLYRTPKTNGTHGLIRL
jgi:hypothetical protein